MTIKEIHKLLSYLFDNNKKLINKGLPKITVNIIGNAGTGKSSIVQQLAEYRGSNYVKLSVAQMSEPGDLLGLPIKEILIKKDEETIWVFEKAIEKYIAKGYELVEEVSPRMSYAIPDWVPTDNSKETIINFDDVTRAPMCILQSMLEIILNGEHMAWKLPSNCQIVTTSNFDNGSYNLTSVDSAFSTRMLTVTADFDERVWAEWADNQGIREEFINFALLEPQIFQSANLSVNARNYTMFANACYGIKDLDKNLPLISNIAKATFGEEEYISSKFCTFINNKLDKLPTPEDILKRDFDILYNELHELIYRDGYRADITSVITFRFINYINRYLKESIEKNKTQKVIDRLIKLVEVNNSKDPIIMSDLIFILAKKLYIANPSSMQKLLINPLFRNKLIND